MSTGLSLDIQEGYYGRLKGRSGLTAKTALRVQEGTIDASYRGEIKVICELRAISLITKYYDISMMIGPGYTDRYTIKRGERIAQLIIQPLPTVEVTEVDELDDTDRGEGGFGSTGI